MLHEPAKPSGKDPAAPYKARLGVKMFAFYALVFAGFVAINLISPLTMGQTIAFGLNLATVYGLGLIIVALVEALIYDAMCRRREAAFASEERTATAEASSNHKRKA
jgi:hypothetical protein